MWSARGRTWETDGVELVGLQPLSAQDLYEFALEDGSSVHLHDGDCIGISYQPSQARLTLSFLFEPRWSPATHPAGCTVRLIFDGAEIIEWQHDPGPQAEAGQCSDLRYCKPRVFTLDLLNDQLSFAATRVSIEVDDSRT